MGDSGGAGKERSFVDVRIEESCDPRFKAHLPPKIHWITVDKSLPP